MIRLYNDLDYDRINEIGSLIKDDFCNVYDISNINDKNYAFIYVYEENNKVIGFIQIEIHFEITDIINIAVDENYQNKGIATELIEFIKNDVEEKIMLEVRSRNEAAIKTYEKNGFKVINIRKKYYGDDDAIIMEWVK